jgi:hypothetical protein
MDVGTAWGGRRPQGTGSGIAMTAQESFKQRVRARMEHTGERYAAARRQLLAQAERRTGRSPRTWASMPEQSDESVRIHTGRSWDAWCDVIDDWPERDLGHGPIAARLLAEFDITGWWAHGVTVGYERITGRRVPYQVADGTFTAGRSKTVPIAPDELKAALLDDAGRVALFPGEHTELRSKPTSKVVRLRIGPGTAQIAIEPASGGRSKVSVAHEKLPTVGVVEEWRFYWAEWLEALDGT